MLDIFPGNPLQIPQSTPLILTSLRSRCAEGREVRPDVLCVGSLCLCWRVHVVAYCVASSIDSEAVKNLIPKGCTGSIQWVLRHVRVRDRLLCLGPRLPGSRG